MSVCFVNTAERQTAFVVVVVVYCVVIFDCLLYPNSLDEYVYSIYCYDYCFHRSMLQ